LSCTAPGQADGRPTVRAAGVSVEILVLSVIYAFYQNVFSPLKPSSSTLKAAVLAVVVEAEVIKIGSGR